jgi:uncharacterized protein YukJ
MPLNHYGVVKGRILEHQLATKNSNHFQLLLKTSDLRFRVPINVQSADGSEVEYLIVDGFEHPVLEGLQNLNDAFHAIPSKAGGIALDFIRANLFEPRDMKPLPFTKPGADNDLNDKIEFWVNRATSDPQARVYAFGERWQDAPGKPPPKTYFHPEPSTGVHDIHMNQGNPRGKFSKDNGVWQDGGLIFQFPTQNHWVAVFLKFQTQAWHTDDQTGQALTDVRPVTEPQPGRQRNIPDGVVRIVAAVPNPIQNEPETVSLLNTSTQAVNLEGWSLLNRQQAPQLLTGMLGAGETAVIELPTAMFSNKGDSISLLDSNGIKIHGVSYSRNDARHKGWTITF